MNDSRLKNTKRIMSTSMLNLIISMILPFINRTIIIYSLGSEFIGLSGLFSSVLQVLSLADFGLSMVIVHYLYEPLVKKNIDMIIIIMSWIRKVYRIVGGLILGGGIAIIPFLPYLIHGSSPKTINIYVLFIILLVNSSISYYLAAYKEVIIIADQRKDIISNINTIVRIGVNILQCIVLLISRNYYVYSVILICGTVSSNVLISIIANKRYPYLTNKENNNYAMPVSIKKEMIGLMINRLSNVSRNAFDSLVISSTIGLIPTAIYGNYFMIYNAAFSFTAVFGGSMQASVGNSIVLRNEHENFEDLLDFSFLYSWITGWCSVVMICLYQPFMKLWVGEELMLSDTNMVLFVIYFYLINMGRIRNQYILGNAFWWKLKTAYLFEAVGNLVLNIVLGKIFGITGVLVATLITIFFCNYLMCNSVLFKNYFKNESICTFYKQQFYYLISAGIIALITYLICCRYENNIIRITVCIFLPSVLFALFYRPCSRWESSMAIVKRVFKSSLVLDEGTR